MSDKKRIRIFNAAIDARARKNDKFPYLVMMLVFAVPPVAYLAYAILTT